MRPFKQLLPCLVAIALCALGFSVTSAAAEPPQVTTPEVSNVASGSPHVKGEVDPNEGFLEWFFEVSTDGVNWDRTSAEGFLGGDGLQPVEGDITALNYGSSSLKAGTTYKIRLSAQDFSGDPLVSSPEAEFTTESVNTPSVSIDPVTTFSTTTATFSGEIDPNPTAGNPGAADVKWHFLCTPECPNLQGGTVPAGAEGAERKVETEATGLEPNTTYEVTLVGKNAGDPVTAGPVSFTTVPVAPLVETMSAFAIQGGTEAIVGGRINPKNSPTTYWIEYGTTSAYGNRAPLTEDASAGSGSTGQVFTQTIGGLTPSTEYHFQLVAENAAGKVEGSDKNFETAPAGPASEPACPNAALRAENNSTALPDCRAYEQVSPVDKNGFDAGANGEIMQPNYIASTEGSALAFESFGAFGDAKAAGLLNQYLSRRGAAGWETHGLTPPQYPAANGTFPGIPWYTPDLHYGAVTGGTQRHLAPGDNPEMSNLYRLDTLDGTFQTLNLGAHPDKSEGFSVGGGSADGSRLFFSSADPLTPGAVDGLNGSGGSLPNVYEWHEGQLHLVSITLDSEGHEVPAPEGGYFPGGGLEPTENDISADGSRVVFQDFANKQLYLREDGVRTVEISASQRAVPDPNEYPVLFAGASEDTSKIFFTSASNLTDDATGGNTKLYRYDLDTGTLTDLLAGALPGSEENVSGVAGVSEDGDYVYFRSTSRFHPGDNQGPGIGIYVWHNGTIKFIASDDGDVEEQVGAEPQAGSSASAPYSTYRISPDGSKLSFVSNGRLTSYDNSDAVSTVNGEPHRDGEVYVYDSTRDRLSCVSCNPSGEQPRGAPDGGPAANSFFPRPPSMAPHNVQPGVRDDGSIFFNSRDALVPEDVNGKMDVYQWKGGRVRLISAGTGGGDSFLASSSADSTDVFFQTRDRLVASDRDENADLYDARVGGGFPRGAEPSLCESIEGCHGPASGSPPVKHPASGTFSSSLKKPNPNAGRLRKALKACKHKKKKKARARCRAAAKKRFGKTSTGRGH